MEVALHPVREAGAFLHASSPQAGLHDVAAQVTRGWGGGRSWLSKYPPTPRSGPGGPADPSSASSSLLELNWGPSFCIYPPDMASPAQPVTSSPRAFDHVIPRSCPFSKSLVLHHKCWKLLSPGKSTQQVSSTQLAHFPLSFSAQLFPSAGWAESFPVWSFLLCFLVTEEAQAFWTDFSVL